MFLHCLRWFAMFRDFSTAPMNTKKLDTTLPVWRYQLSTATIAVEVLDSLY